MSLSGYERVEELMALRLTKNLGTLMPLIDHRHNLGPAMANTYHLQRNKSGLHQNWSGNLRNNR